MPPTAAEALSTWTTNPLCIRDGFEGQLEILDFKDDWIPVTMEQVRLVHLVTGRIVLEVPEAVSE